jgi:hypothetical protein
MAGGSLRDDAGAGDACRRGLGALKGRINFLPTSGKIEVRWTTNGYWSIEIKDYVEVRPVGLSLKILTNSVQLAAGTNDISLETWLATKPSGRADTKGKMRPEVAIAEGLKFWSRSHNPAILLDPQGRIQFWRDKACWKLDLFGYRKAPIGGYWITVHDDGEVAMQGGL